MKKNLSLLTVVLAAGMFSAPAYAAEHYVSGNLGFNWMNDAKAKDSAGNLLGTDRFKSGWNAVGAIGCKYDMYRYEAEAGFQKNDLKNSGLRANVTSLMANGYLDVFKMGGIEPYLTAGLGVARVRFHDTGVFTDQETTLAYQVGAGIAFPIGGSTAIDARYRYFATTDFTSAMPAITNYEHLASSSVSLGLRVGF
jgi:opacity protein-like surface antigen